MTSRATHALFNGNQKIEQNEKPTLLRLAQKGNPPVGECGQAESIHSNLLPLLEILPLTPRSTAERRASVFKNYFTEIGG